MMAKTIKIRLYKKPQLSFKTSSQYYILCHHYSILICNIMTSHRRCANSRLGLHQTGNTKRFVCFATKEATQSRVTAAPLSVGHHRALRPAVFFMKLSTNPLLVHTAHGAAVKHVLLIFRTKFILYWMVTLIDIPRASHTDILSRLLPTCKVPFGVYMQTHTAFNYSQFKSLRVNIQCD